MNEYAVSQDYVYYLIYFDSILYEVFVEHNKVDYEKEEAWKEI